MTIVSVKDAGAIGVVADAIAQDLPPNAWTSASNVRFRDGCAERFLGDEQVFTTPAVTPYFLAPYQTTSKRFWVHAGTAAVYADDGTARTDITGTAPTGAATDRWTGGTLNGVFILNNGVDQPMFWGGDTGLNLATLTGWNANWRCKSLRPFKNYILALNLTKTGVNYPHMVKWSHAAEPGTVPASWDEADPTKDAGEVDLAETPDLIVDGMALGDTFVVYKQRSMYAASYIGQPYIFRFQRLPGEYGILTRGCVADTPVGHVVLTAGDVIVHQGQGARSILTGKMRRWLFTQMDSDNYAASFVVTNPWRNEVWICFPEAGATACTKALVWNWNDGTFGVRTLDNVTYGAAGQMDFAGSTSWAADTATWDSDTSGWNQNEFSQAEARLLLSSSAPKILSVDTGALMSGSNVVASLERTGLAFDAPYQSKMVRAVYPRIDAAQGTTVQIQVGASMDAEAEPTWSAPVTYTVGSTFKADVIATGRILAVRFSSTSAQPWRIRSYDLDIVPLGAY
jgi:hypothetical protein